jgi:hypothetical protein
LVPVVISQSSTPSEPRAQRVALDELHRDERRGVRLTDLEDGDDVGVIESRERACLVPEPAEAIVIALSGGRQKLDGDLAAQLLVEGSVDDAHPAFADAVADPIPRRNQQAGQACTVRGHARVSIEPLNLRRISAAAHCLVRTSGPGSATLRP